MLLSDVEANIRRSLRTFAIFFPFSAIMCRDFYELTLVRFHQGLYLL